MTIQTLSFLSCPKHHPYIKNSSTTHKGVGVMADEEDDEWSEEEGAPATDMPSEPALVLIEEMESLDPNIFTINMNDMKDLEKIGEGLCFFFVCLG